jgi:hypothetical protein
MAMLGLYKTMARKAWVVLVTVLVLVGGALVLAQGQGQDQDQRQARRNRGQLRDQGGVPLTKARPDAADPLTRAARGGAGLPQGTFHYNFLLHSFDGAPLAASYYPSKLGSTAPAVMLIHESGRSRKDFEDPVSELNGQGLAEYLQGLNYAVFSFDLRGHGQNQRRAVSVRERPLVVEDLQAAYFFLVDRHNRGDLNLAKLGVIALGDGANLAALWAVQPGAAITTEGRPSDLSALALIAPMPEGYGFVLRHLLTSLSPRIPILLQAGERDLPSRDAVQSSRQLVERTRLNKVEIYPSSLHGYKLLRLEPKVTTTLFHFLDSSLRGRAVEWEPQFNLIPVSYSKILVVRNTTKSDNTRKSLPEPKALDQTQKGAEPATPKAGDAENPPPRKAKRRSNRPDRTPPPER